jgi:SAM-dependent methyltransferase
MASVKSPLVASSTVHLLATFQAAKLIKDWHTSFAIDISDELDGIDDISLYRCEDSKLDFFIPTSAAGSDQLYQNLQRLEWFYMEKKWEFEQAIKDLVGCKKILEVGCGPGFFVEKAMKELRGSSVRGIELTQSTLDRAVKRNLPVERVDLLELAAKGEIFDAVCSFQVLEHVSQPGDLLQAMVQILAPGGKLIVCVPNRDSFLRYQYNLLDMPPHHMTRWSATTLAFLEKLLPLKLSRIKFEPLAPYHIHGYVSAYGQHWRYRLPLGRHVFSDTTLQHLTSFLVNTSLYRFLRGQSLYVLFEKV